MEQKTKTRKTKAQLEPQGFARTWPLLGIGLAILVFIFDQISKWIVLNHLMVPPHTRVVTPFFNIILAWNRGVSFGFLSSGNPYGAWILAAIAFTFSTVLTLWILKAETKLLALAFGLVLGGAVGNLLDRLRFGAVTDFLDFHAYGFHWYTFNVADSTIVIGVGLIILQYVKELWADNKK